MNKNTLKEYIIPSIICSIIIISIFFYGCIKKVNTNKSIINYLLIYYPNYNISIVNDDPNIILIKIKKIIKE